MQQQGEEKGEPGWLTRRRRRRERSRHPAPTDGCMPSPPPFPPAAAASAPGTAGALMTPEIIIMGANSTVAEALAQVRDPEWLVSIASQVYVVQPPFKAPTGTYLGVVHIQRLLREPPGTELGRCVTKEPTVTPNVSDREVAEFLASYNLLAVGVCDESGQLLGAITVDDVLDRMLPADWRQRRRQAAQS